MLLKTLPIVILASAAIFTAPAARAGQLAFSYHAHELETAGGAEALYKRIASRAHRACVEIGARSLRRKAAESRCEAVMIDDLVRKIDDRRLDRIHAEA